MAIASQAAIAIQNARLFEETRTRAEEMAALNQLSQRLTTHLDIAGILEEAYRGATHLMDTTNFTVALYDEYKDEISFVLDRTDGQPANEGRSYRPTRDDRVRHPPPRAGADQRGTAQWRAEKD